MDLSEIQHLSSLLIERIPNILSYFNLDFNDRTSYYSGFCPCHPSDNNRSCIIYKETGIWKCFTQHCEEKHGINLLGLIRGIYKNNGKNGVHNGQFYEFVQSTFLDSPLTPKLYTFKNGCTNTVRDFGKIHSLVKESESYKFEKICHREQILSRLTIPSPYFLSRGLSSEILRLFDVGDCKNAASLMKNRAVCPVYDIDGKILIGYTGRHILNEDPKWLHSKNLPSNRYFYGLWIAKEEIERVKSVILVEGMGDVLRCHELGFTNTLGCFANKLSNQQMLLLNELGVENITILMDGDDAGQIAAKSIVEKCKNWFNMVNVVLPNKMDPLDIEKENLIKILEKCCG